MPDEMAGGVCAWLGGSLVGLLSDGWGHIGSGNFSIPGVLGEWERSCGGSGVVLRNEARDVGRCAAGRGAAIFLEAQEGVEGFVEGALVGGVVAEEEGEAFFVYLAVGEAVVLEAEGALGEPIGLRYLLDQQLFGRVGGLVV